MKTYRVYLYKGNPITVEAEYWRIIDGAAVFRCGQDANRYPLNVHVFAGGAWSHVELMHLDVT